MSDNEEKPRVQGGEVTELRYSQGSVWRSTRKRYFKTYNGSTPVGSGSERKPLSTVAEPLPAPKPRVDFHVEKRGIILLNGKVTHVSSCTATDCWWSDTPDAHDDSRYVKRHSDKKKHPLEVDDMPVVEPTEDGDGVQEVSTDDPQELSAETDLLAAANGQIEFAPEQGDENVTISTTFRDTEVGDSGDESELNEEAS